jgi:hypothetical protein
MPKFFTKPKEDTKRRNVKTNLAALIDRINNNSLPEPLEEVGPNVVMPVSFRGTYFITDDEGHVEGAIYCSDYRDVITEGLGPEHSDSTSMQSLCVGLRHFRHSREASHPSYAKHSGSSGRRKTQ